MLHQHIIHFLRDWKKTGAVMPSSKYLARDAVRRVVNELKKPDREPISILEIGAGTGTFTERILPHLKNGDRLDAIELHSYFFKLLQRRFRVNGDFKLHHKDFLKFRSEKKYDFVISSLPYEQIPAVVTRKLWEHKLSFCKPNSFIIYYKYVNFNQFRSRFEKQLVRNCFIDEKLIIRNVPPARLITLKINDPAVGKIAFREVKKSRSRSGAFNVRRKRNRSLFP